MAIVSVKTEITGNVWKIVATTGQRVAEDDPIMILESMKMEIPVSAPEGGTVTEIPTQGGRRRHGRFHRCQDRGGLVSGKRTMSAGDKVLIANRGEIARRVMSTCRRLGIATVAVHSEADANAAHVADADETVLIGPARAQESYLLSERILAAAAKTGATAIHPGYGFLSENAAFARAVLANRLIWIGPKPSTIELMGDKQRAREAAIAAGVPVVPGSRRFEPADLEGLEDAAKAVGYPLLVKAAGGGGGIGMRRVDNSNTLRAAVEFDAIHSAKVIRHG